MRAKRSLLRGLSGLLTVLPLGCASIVGADFDEKHLTGSTGTGQGGSGGEGGSGGAGGSCPIGAAQIKRIAAGHQHTCAVTSDNRVKCWGSNDSGQLGLGTVDMVPHPVPAVVPCLSDVIQVAAGKSHTCALTILGEVLCWGGNHVGQLGTDNFMPYLTPQKVVTLDSFIEIVAGDDFTCARNGSSEAFCWGANNHKQLGSTFDVMSSEVPTGVILMNSTAIAAGSEHGCAIHKANELACWGNNAAGQAGQDPISMPDVDTPETVAIMGGPSELAAGGHHSCALNAGGMAYCWGSNSSGQLGTGGEPNGSDSPAVVSFFPVTPLASISLGGLHSCAIAKFQKGVFCWGENASGQLGTGNTVPQSMPAAVDLGSKGGGVALALGYAHSCILTEHAVKCWGDNTLGQLGVPDLEPSANPVDALTW